MRASIAAAVSVLVVAAIACGRAPTAPRDAGRSQPPTVATKPVGPVPTSSPLEQLIKSAELGPYWHADQAGRVPVRIVENPNSSDRPAFTMFGAPVQWIDRSLAAAGSAYVEVEFTLTDGVLYLRLAYPIEGVMAKATFFPDGAGWRRQGRVEIVEHARR